MPIKPNYLYYKIVQKKPIQVRIERKMGREKIIPLLTLFTRHALPARPTPYISTYPTMGYFRSVKAVTEYRPTHSTQLQLIILSHRLYETLNNVLDFTANEVK